MSIPAFTEQGFLPEGIHDATVEEIKARFGTFQGSDRRPKLFNNTPQERIADALDEAGIYVTQRNISNWKTRGGYREWCLAQEYAIHFTTIRTTCSMLSAATTAANCPKLASRPRPRNSPGSSSHLKLTNS